MLNLEKFRPKLNDRSEKVYLAIREDAEKMSWLRWAKKNRMFECGNIRINNYQTAIEAVVDEKAEELGIRLSIIEKGDIQTNLILDS